MTLEEILESWEQDCIVDKTELAEEALKIPNLHSKYLRILSTEKLKLKKLESEYKILKLEKYEFYTQGHTEDTMKKGWQLPAKGMILKADIPMYMEADEDIINSTLKISYQNEKIEALDTIIRSVMNRGYHIKSAIDWNKFIMGAN
jgi:hypothetical protein